MNTLPADIKQKLKTITTEINKKTSSQLLEYSQTLHAVKDTFHPKVYGLILDSIDSRRAYLNAGYDKISECWFDKMVQKFKGGKRW